MEVCCDSLIPVTFQPRLQGVSARPAGDSDLRRAILSDLPLAREAERDCEVLDDGTSRVFTVTRVTLTRAHDGYRVTATGEDLRRQWSDCELLEDTYHEATLDLGFVGREECNSGWYDRLMDAAEEEWGPGYKVGRAAVCEVLLQV